MADVRLSDRVKENNSSDTCDQYVTSTNPFAIWPRVELYHAQCNLAEPFGCMCNISAVQFRFSARLTVYDRSATTAHCNDILATVTKNVGKHVAIIPHHFFSPTYTTFDVFCAKENVDRILFGQL